MIEMHNATTVFSTGIARFDGKECEMVGDMGP